MEVYAQPIFVAALVFVFLTFLLFVPWCIYTYRKYGFLSISKSIVVFSFIFYFFSALFLVLLPLPETTNYCAQIPADTVFYNLRPFQFISDILYNSGISLASPGSWLLLFKQPSFYQAFFNFLLLMPLGVYIRYFFKQRRYWKLAFGIGLAMTLFYEITQVTGIYGIYDCPYRIFDVDDLLLNSVGAVVGFLLAPIILALLPSHDEVVEHAEQVKTQDDVGPLQKLLAFIVDTAIISIVWRLLVFVSGETSASFEFVYMLLMYAVIFAIVPIATGGATPGMLLLKFRMVDEEGNGNVSNTLRRYIAIFATYCTFKVIEVLNSFPLNMESDYYVIAVFTTLITFILAFVLYISIVLHIIWVLIGRGKRRYYIDKVARLRGTKK